MPSVILAVVAFALSAGVERPALTLEVRVFDGTQEVTTETRITVHRGGERVDPVVRTTARNGRIEMTIPAGIYDVQALRERNGRVLNIRWAQRLVVMDYPDEAGRHLEVINFTNGYGALQVRQRGTAGVPDAAIYAPADHHNPAGVRAEGSDYLLFVVPGGTYDVLTHTAGRATWHQGIEVPLDRTRLWFVP